MDYVGQLQDNNDVLDGERVLSLHHEDGVVYFNLPRYCKGKRVRYFFKEYTWEFFGKRFSWVLQHELWLDQNGDGAPRQVLKPIELRGGVQ